MDGSNAINGRNPQAIPAVRASTNVFNSVEGLLNFIIRFLSVPPEVLNVPFLRKLYSINVSLYAFECISCSRSVDISPDVSASAVVEPFGAMEYLILIARVFFEHVLHN